MKKLLPLLLLIVISCSKNEESDTNNAFGKLVDRDGNTYKTLKIGNQTWMLENLKTTKYNDGTPIPKYALSDKWNSIAHYQWANTNDLNNVFSEELPSNYYGAMYSDLVLDSGKLAPTGWRIPSKKDFEILENYLKTNGHSGNEGKALKSKTGWIRSGFGTDTIGFNGLANGYVDALGTPKASEIISNWATTTKTSDGFHRIVINLVYDQNTISYAENIINIGVGVRCIKE
ncbi:FISUMP domain-containing protein [Flavobacterium sp. GNP001]